MNPEQPATGATRPPPKASKKSVLLIGADSERQALRATALRARGIIVDAAPTGAAALGLWKTGSYQLVMIEPAGAAADVDGFYRHVLDQKPSQRFAFYSPERPYLTASVSNRRASAHSAADAPGRQAGFSSGGLWEAASRIGGLKSALRRVRPSEAAALPDIVPPPSTPPEIPTSFSEAVKNAERDLERGS